jgi:hypothetical protein
MIGAGMRENPDTFIRGVLFAVCSIQQSIIRVPMQLRDIDRGNLSPLFGHKREAYDYLQDHGCGVWHDIAWRTERAPDVAEYVIGALCKVPGLGIVKSAFIAQMLGHDVACLDTINIRREKRNPRAYRSDGPDRKSTAAFQRKIQRYVAETFGRAEHYWNSWCIDRADFYEMTPEEMSAIHLEVIK